MTTDMSIEFRGKKKFSRLKPMLGVNFYQMLNQRIELQRNKMNNYIYAVVKKNIEGAHGIARCRIDEIKGIIDV